MTDMGCGCAYYVDEGDLESPGLYAQEWRKARKKHKCCECEGDILPGRHYEHVWATYDSGATAFDTCSACILIKADVCVEGHMILREVVGKIYKIDIVTDEVYDDEEETWITI